MKYAVVLVCRDGSKDKDREDSFVAHSGISVHDSFAEAFKKAKKEADETVTGIYDNDDTPPNLYVDLETKETYSVLNDALEGTINLFLVANYKRDLDMTWYIRKVKNSQNL